MTTALDPQTMREAAEQYVRRHLANIDHGDILDEMLGDEQFAHLLTGDEDEDIATLDPIAAEIKDRAKAAALSWPDEQPTAEEGGDVRAVAACCSAAEMFEHDADCETRTADGSAS